ncbi:MAG: aromatic ring-hydroxylating dioxygenase subunit alpha [Alphaproteobacteria bacterium]
MDTIVREGWSTLPSRYYYGEDIYEQEKEKIFYRSWFSVARAEEVAKPRDYVVRTVGDESMIIARDDTGAINAFYNVCPHRGNRLCTEAAGTFRGGAVSCRYHAWTFAPDGKLIATPRMVEPAGFRKEEHSLYRAHVHEWEGFVFVSLAKTPPAFAPNLGHIAPYVPHYNIPNLRIAHTVSYELNTNWKLVIENFCECFHCPTVHPELCRINPEFREGIIKQESTAGARFLDGGNSFSIDAKTNRPLISTVTDEDTGGFRSTSIYPNLLMLLVPDHVMYYVLWPKGPAATTVEVKWLFEPAAMATPGFDASDTIAFMDMVNKQDWGITEDVQLAIRSRAHVQGFYSPQEHLPHKFNQWVLEQLA